jgi:hypothetical protein
MKDYIVEFRNAFSTFDARYGFIVDNYILNLFQQRLLKFNIGDQELVFVILRDGFIREYYKEAFKKVCDTICGSYCWVTIADIEMCVNYIVSRPIENQRQLFEDFRDFVIYKLPVSPTQIDYVNSLKQWFENN